MREPLIIPNAQVENFSHEITGLKEVSPAQKTRETIVVDAKLKCWQPIGSFGFVSTHSQRYFAG